MFALKKNTPMFLQLSFGSRVTSYTKVYAAFLWLKSHVTNFERWCGNFTKHSLWSHVTKWLMKNTENRSGPHTEPWGTPCVRCVFLDLTPPGHTLVTFSEKMKTSQLHLRTFPQNSVSVSLAATIIVIMIFEASSQIFINVFFALRLTCSEDLSLFSR